MLLPVARRRGRKSRVGLIHTELEVHREGGPREKVRLLLDSGAVYSVLPERVWRVLELEPMRSMTFTLADGTPVVREVAECRFVYRGVEATSPVVLGEPKDAALLGAVTLETLGLMLNPFERSLWPMRMMLAAAS